MALSGWQLSRLVWAGFAQGSPRHASPLPLGETFPSKALIIEKIQGLDAPAMAWVSVDPSAPGYAYVAPTAPPVFLSAGLTATEQTVLLARNA
jgi:hypothetical protein